MSKTDHIEWAEIEAECGDYRTGFVSVFRRYEGQLTDERDAQGRGVKVTATSFARHMGIAERTFRRWVGQNGQRGRPDHATRDESGAKKVLRDPELRRQVIESLKPDEVEALAEQATERLVQNARAQRAEHATEPTVRDLTGGERFDPSEHWADTLVIRVNRNARELASLIKRAGGLLYGSMSPEEAFEYLHEAEGMIAEARAAAQEQVRDEVRV